MAYNNFNPGYHQTSVLQTNVQLNAINFMRNGHIQNSYYDGQGWGPANQHQTTNSFHLQVFNGQISIQDHFRQIQVSVSFLPPQNPANGVPENQNFVPGVYNNVPNDQQRYYTPNYDWHTADYRVPENEYVVTETDESNDQCFDQQSVDVQPETVTPSSTSVKTDQQIHSDFVPWYCTEFQHVPRNNACGNKN